MSSSTVRVKDIQGKQYPLTIYNLEATTLGHLKVSLQGQSGIPSVQQKLIFQGQTLNNDSKRLSELGIVNESILHILVLSGWTVKVDNLMSPGSTQEVFMEGQSSELQLKKVIDIKREIIRQTTVSRSLRQHEIRLMKGSCELRDQATLQEAGIIDQVTIQMKKKYYPPWNIFIHGIDGKSHSLKIDRENPEETTIAQVKRLLQDKTGLTPSEQRLCFNSKPLEDHQKLEDHNICNNSTLFLVVRLRGGSRLQGMIGLLRESPTSTINNVSNCPIFRACPHCGTLLEHTGGCNNMTCYSCKKNFCFVCLAMPTSGSSIYTFSCGNQCKYPAARQTVIKTS